MTFAAEPQATALLVTALGLLMGLGVLLSRLAGRMRVPVMLLYLGIGLLAGAESLGGIPFENYGLSFRLGTVSLVLILFDGGLNTSRAVIARALGPASLLATVGVALTAAVVALGGWLFGLPWHAALLVGAVVSSTDAAAVFAVLRGSRIELGRRVATTLELESGLNDPLAVLLTMTLTHLAGAGHVGLWSSLGEIPLEIGIGLGGGILVGRGARAVLRRLHLPIHGLVPVFTTACAFLAFGLATLLHGSGFLAVYVAAVLLGNSELPYKTGVLRVHDALAWFSQVGMFLLLGLLAVPSRLVGVAGLGLLLVLVLTLVARPLATLVCLAPFGYRLREIVYVGWVGLRGAVPIILASYPVLAGVPDAQRVFDITFFVVALSALVPGATVHQVTRWLGVEVRAPPPPPAVLEIASTRPLRDVLLTFYIEEASAVAGASIADLPLPEDAAVMLVARGEDLLPPKESTVLRPGDHVYVFCRPADRALVLLLFGREEEE